MFQALSCSGACLYGYSRSTSSGMTKTRTMIEIYEHMSEKHLPRALSIPFSPLLDGTPGASTDLEVGYQDTAPS